MKHTSPTYEWVESRHLDGAIIRESRDRIVAQHKINRVKVQHHYYSYTKNKWQQYETEEDRFDYHHFDALIECEYLRLRRLYSIPYTFDDFQDHIYKHHIIRRWGYNREAAKHNERIRYRRRWIAPWRISTSGESRFVQHGIKKKELSETEQSRREWKENKQFNRDRLKHNGHWWSGSRRRKWECTQQNREDRRSTKRLLQNEEYDKLFSRLDPRDPWRWD